MGFLDLFKKKKEKQKMYLYSEQELNEYEAYIESCFGSYDKVLHEVVSPDIHLDIILVPPTEEYNFYKLITMGVGAYPMHVPSELREYELEHMELIAFLPPNWEIYSHREQDYWPIRYLKIMGRLPIEQQTWLGFGHTVGGGESFAENTDLNSIVLLSACDLQYEPMELRMSSGKKINFYQMYPLYDEELKYKMNYGLDALCERIDDEDIFPLVNIQRKNYGQE